MKCSICKFYNICKGRLNEAVENCVRFKSAEQTNEEWFCRLSTEEKAKHIAKSMFFYDSQFGLTIVEALRKSIEYEDGLNETIEHDVIEWLKQPHTTEE